MAAFGFDIQIYFRDTCYKGFEDNQQKDFYSVYRNVFEKIKAEEERAWKIKDKEKQFANDYEKPPGFGDS